MEQRKAKRPWLAVALAIPVIGLGHLYLRRWARAAGWFFALMATSIFFVPPEELETMNAASEAMLSGSQSAAALPSPDFVALAPVFIIFGLSIIDAYLIARRENARLRAQQEAVAVGEGVDHVVTCPACGRDVDPELDFCHWCTTRLQHPTDEETNDI